jgi:hypothetical protein
MPVRDRELVAPPPSLASLQELSSPALIAMLLADEIAEDRAQAAIKRHGGEPRDDIAVLVLHCNSAR